MVQRAYAEGAERQALAAVTPELSVWASGSVQSGVHVQFEKLLYSVPFRLVGPRPWLKAGSEMVNVFQDHRLVATHTRVRAAGGRSTVRDYLPPDALA